MPSKYSHSVVLANYSSRGIISFPITAQQADSTTSSQPAARVDTPSKHTRNTSTSVSSSKGKPATVASDQNALSAASHHATLSAKSQRALSNQGRQSLSQHHETTADVIQRRTQKDNSTESTQTPPRRSPKKAGLTGPRPISPYGPYNGHSESIPPGGSPDLTNKRHQDQNATEPLKRTVAYAAQTVQPRPGPPPSAGTRPPPVSVKRVPSQSTASGRLEALLSLQQFLDSSPRIERSKDLTKPQAPTPEPRPPVRALIASPVLSSDTSKPTSAGQRNATSFIDSSDEDDHVDNTPETSVRSATTAPVASSKPEASNEQQVKVLRKEHIPSGKVRLDLTKSLPAIPDRDNSARGPQLPRASHNKSDQTHAGNVSEDVDDPFGPLPLQRHSPLRRTTRKEKRRSLGSPYPSLRETEDEASYSHARPATKSAESLPHDAGSFGLEPDFSNLADGSEDDRDHEDDTHTMMDIHVHRRYYRAVDDDIPQDEPRPRISTPNSWPSRRAAARTPTPVPWQSPTREPEARNPTPNDEDEFEGISEPNILTDAQPRSSKNSVDLIQDFGVPSIIRSPVKSPRAKTPQGQRRGGTESMARPSKMSRTRSLQRHKQARSQHPPLTCIAEAKSQDETPSSSMWKLPTMEATDSGVFGAEVLMRLPSEIDTGTESESGRAGKEAEFDDSQRRSQDHYLLDISTVPGDQVAASSASNRSPSRSIPHHTSANQNLGSTVSLPTTRAEAARPRTRHSLIHGSDLEYNEDEADEDDDEDEDEAPASPPPDITRYRRPREDDSGEYDGLQSLIHALRTGPSPNPAGTKATAKYQLTGIDRFEEMMRRADAEDRKKQQQQRQRTKNRMGGVLGRLLKR